MAQRTVGRLGDAHRAVPFTGAKTAGWLIGHLAVTGDFARYLCGAPSLCSRDWRDAYGPGSHPSSDPRDYPSMTSLSKTFIEVYSSLCHIARTTDAARLDLPNPYEAARPAFPTAGDFVRYLMSSHFAYHLGQLNQWCGGAGLGRINAPEQPGT